MSRRGRGRARRRGEKGGGGRRSAPRMRAGACMVEQSELRPGNGECGGWATAVK
uniref:Uncharacterized protein n=1 Tax=Arundo donax TaxID=35708 RepID=A0A0A8YX03_ARUDO